MRVHVTGATEQTGSVVVAASARAEREACRLVRPGSGALCPLSAPPAPGPGPLESPSGAVRA